jgi:signal peptidase I
MANSTTTKRKPLGKTGGRSSKKSGGLFDTIKTVIYAVLIAGVIRTLAFEPFNIPSGSMIPTLLIGDYLFVAKYAYGYSHFSLPFSPDIFSGRILGSVPRRGDVVVFKLPRDTSVDYIKRVIGLPGDTVQVKDGLLYINGQQVPRQEAGDYTVEDEFPAEVDKQYLESLPGGPAHDIIKRFSTGVIDGLDPNNTEVYTVPPGMLFMMGDNRDNSMDSRFQNDVGFVPMENLVGKAEFIFFSIGGTAPAWEFWLWPVEIRWWRIMKGIT